MKVPLRVKLSTTFFGQFLVLLCLLTIGLQSQAFGLPDFTELVEEASPSVVNISTSTRPSTRQKGPMTEEDLQQIPEFFRHFFGTPYGRGEQQPRTSMGSGFIVSKDGYILTNNHVINGADEIIVRLSDRRELVATLIGADERSDLALLKVESDDLPVVKMGKSKNLKVGEWVLAIGSPFGFDYSVTAGIISALGRSLPNENYVPFIQTDAAINPGNSGGPLFNLDGEVIGINSQIYTRSGGFMGVSFAIPVDVAMEVVDQIKQKGFVSRGWLGVLIQEVSRDLAESFGLKKPHGALVAQVVPGSPAEAGGLKPGDVIVEYEGDEISLSSDLPHLVGRTKVGTEASMIVVRAGERKSMKVVIGELPGGEGVVIPATQKSEMSNRLNVQVVSVDEKTVKQLELNGGVLIQSVGPGPAMAAGIRSGDIVSSINNQPVETVQQFNDLVEALPANRAIPMLILRGGNPAFVVLKIKTGG